MSEHISEEREAESQNKNSVGNLKGAVFLFGVTCMSILGGFGITVGRARKSAPDAFAERHNEATRLATRALGYGTLLSVTGCGLLVVAACKVLGINSFDQIRINRNVSPNKDDWYEEIREEFADKHERKK